LAGKVIAPNLAQAVLIVSGNPFLLEVSDLTVDYKSKNGLVRAVDGADLEVRSGEIYGLVGESGSGKTTLALSILGLIEPPGQLRSGTIVFDGSSILELEEEVLDLVRGAQIGMVFQNARSSLNPTFSIGYQTAEVMQVHLGLKRRAARAEAEKWLERVGLPGFARSYPHQLSGGQAQRALLAIALAPGPKLLIADEPTSALDVTVQAQMLDLIKGHAIEYGTTILLITHDLAVIAETAQRVGVMHNGRIVEQLPVKELFERPQHAITKNLLRSVLTLGDG
jgi:ABC-type dipeptide/oligopeptide/nickel transport system ATPase component